MTQRRAVISQAHSAGSSGTELQTQKFRAWEHHLTMTTMAIWFIAQSKYDWAQTYARDPELARELELKALPALSVANVRELLQATMPLPQLSPSSSSPGCQ